MKFLVISSFIFFSAFSAFAQTEVRGLPQSELFFRAKALGMVIIEDYWLRGLSIGGEYRIDHQFAFSADYVNYRTRVEEEVHDIPEYPEDYNEYSQYDARNYWAFQLKWYPQFCFDFYGVQPYVSLMYKTGGRKLYNQDKFPIKENDLIGISGDFYDAGFVFGFLTSGPIGGDIGLGFRQRTETRWEARYHENASSTYEQINEVKYNLVLRTNFYVKIFGWKNKKDDYRYGYGD